MPSGPANTARFSAMSGHPPSVDHLLKRALQEASGYMDLGMPVDADDALAALPDWLQSQAPAGKADHRTLPCVEAGLVPVDFDGLDFFATDRAVDIDQGERDAGGFRKHSPASRGSASGSVVSSHWSSVVTARGTVSPSARARTWVMTGSAARWNLRRLSSLPAALSGSADMLIMLFGWLLVSVGGGPCERSGKMAGRHGGGVDCSTVSP